MNWLLAYLAIAWTIRIVMLLAILRRNFAPGATIAWLLVVFLHPYIGLLLYMVFAQRRLGPGRVALHQELLKVYSLPNPEASFLETLPASAQALSRLGNNVGHMPPMPGNAVEFIRESSALIERLVVEIDASVSHVHLLYYIFAPDSYGLKVAEALERAVKRGVKCRVILDEYASRAVFRADGFASRLRSVGIKIVAALPTSPLRRRDLRNHRKLAVIDDRVAFCGSHNLINPDYGGRRGAPWIDLSGRFTGPIVAELATVFAGDWAFETNERLPVPTPDQIASVAGGIPMQTVPSGPVSMGESFRRVLLGIIESAQRELIFTTPYFVPDEPTVLALLTAKDRGVDVTLVLPDKSDNIFTAAASRAHFHTLLNAGIRLFFFRPGLLHTKTITVDGQIAVMGSANIDVRSFYLNFELSMLLYDSSVTEQLQAVQQSYISQSRQMHLDDCDQRSLVFRYIDAVVALISPLL
ncbi:MAG TPA: cardiolipin synthase [Tepidisphaeraceae bacterium]|jgi:cardiolipin synthase